MKINYVVRKIFVSITLLICLSCTKKSKESDIYIVPSLPKFIEVNGRRVPMPMYPYYTESNFIIDSLGQVYFYKQGPRITCGAGHDSFELPEYIHLTPFDIIHVPEKGIEDFIKFNVINSNNHHKAVTIGSLKDEVESKSLTKMFKFFEDSTERLPRLFRRATFEERIVLKYYQSGDDFNPNDINWDSTQIKMYEKIDLKSIPK